MLKKTLLAACILGLTNAAQAEIRPVIELGLEMGGDSLVSTTTEDMNAGGGIYLGVGVDFVTGDDNDIFYRAMVGYLFDSIEFTSPNGDASTSVIPINLGAFKRFNQHEVGIGLAYHVGPSRELCISGCSNVDFDNSIGFYVQYNYHYGEGGHIGGKYTNMEYSADGSAALDASSLGFYIGYSF